MIRHPTVRRMLRAAPVTLQRRLSGRPGGRPDSGNLAYTSVGPGERARLHAMSQALLRHEPDCRLLVVDDVTGADLRQLERDPRVDVTGRWRPRGYPTGLLRLVLESFALALERYEFDVLLKIDTDGMVLRPGVFAEARACFDREPEVGMAGSYLSRAEAEHDEHRFAWLVPILEGVAAVDRRFGEAWEAAHANGYRPGEHVQGGVYVLPRRVLEALQDVGLLRWRPRLETVLYDDVVLSMFVRAVGFRPASLEPTIQSRPNSMPLSLERVAEVRPAAVHTVKRGLHGESEQKVRECLSLMQRPPA